MLVRPAQAYYCVALLVAELPGSAYLNVLWLFLIEPPALGLAVVAADHLGRRVTFGATPLPGTVTACQAHPGIRSLTLGAFQPALLRKLCLLCTCSLLLVALCSRSSGGHCPLDRPHYASHKDRVLGCSAAYISPVKILPAAALLLEGGAATLLCAATRGRAQLVLAVVGRVGCAGGMGLAQVRCRVP